MNSRLAVWIALILTVVLCQGCSVFSIDSRANTAANAERILIVSGLAEDSGELLSNSFVRAFQARAHACALRTSAITLADLDIRLTPYADAMKTLTPDAYLVVRRTGATADADGKETAVVYWIKLSDPNQRQIFWSADVSVNVSRRLKASEGDALAAELLRRMQQDRALRACSKQLK